MAYIKASIVICCDLTCGSLGVHYRHAEKEKKQSLDACGIALLTSILVSPCLKKMEKWH